MIFVDSSLWVLQLCCCGGKMHHGKRDSGELLTFQLPRCLKEKSEGAGAPVSPIPFTRLCPQWYVPKALPIRGPAASQYWCWPVTTPLTHGPLENILEPNYGKAQGREITDSFDSQFLQLTWVHMLVLDKIQFPAFYQKLSISVLHLKLCSKGSSDDLI